MTDELLSALVVMRSADGARVSGEAVTAATIDWYAPDPEAVRAVHEFMSVAGFEASELVGISFSITAPQSRFETFFDTRLSVAEYRGIKTVTTEEGLELPLAALPEALRQFVDVITFTPPPDFGPTDYAGFA